MSLAGVIGTSPDDRGRLQPSEAIRISKGKNPLSTERDDYEIDRGIAEDHHYLSLTPSSYEDSVLNSPSASDLHPLDLPSSGLPLRPHPPSEQSLPSSFNIMSSVDSGHTHDEEPEDDNFDEALLSPSSRSRNAPHHSHSRQKLLYPVSKSLFLEWGEHKGLEWAYNSCFVDSILFSLFAFQDTFDAWLLKDFCPNNLPQSTSSASISTDTCTTASTNSHSISDPQTPNSTQSCSPLNGYGDQGGIFLEGTTQRSGSAQNHPILAPEEFFSPFAEFHLNDAPVIAQQPLYGTGMKPSKSVSEGLPSTSPLVAQYGHGNVMRTLSAPISSKSSSPASHGEFQVPNVQQSGASRPVEPESAQFMKPGVTVKDVVRAQVRLRKIVNVLRSKAFVPSHLVTEWRSHLYRKCGVEVAFKYKSELRYQILLHRKGGDVARGTNSTIDASEIFNGARDLSSMTIGKSECRLDFRTAHLKSSLPNMIYTELHPRNKHYDALLIEDVQAEFADASEMLHSIMELFNVHHSITLRTEIETHQGSHFVEEKQKILFVGVCREASLQQLIDQQFASSQDTFLDSEGIRRKKTTRIVSVEGEGVIVTLKRVRAEGDLRHLDAPVVLVDHDLTIAGSQFELTSIVCQYANHYYTFTRHPTKRSQWYYFNDRVVAHPSASSPYEDPQQCSQSSSHPVVQPLSAAFGFQGFAKTSAFETKLLSLIAMTGYIFTYRRKS